MPRRWYALSGRCHTGSAGPGPPGRRPTPAAPPGAGRVELRLRSARRLRSWSRDSWPARRSVRRCAPRPGSASPRPPSQGRSIAFLISHLGQLIGNVDRRVAIYGRHLEGSMDRRRDNPPGGDEVVQFARAADGDDPGDRTTIQGDIERLTLHHPGDDRAGVLVQLAYRYAFHASNVAHHVLPQADEMFS